VYLYGAPQAESNRRSAYPTLVVREVNQFRASNSVSMVDGTLFEDVFPVILLDPLM
jgi:hypothetical protein